ncbi:hypothetical protein [Paraburkholderia phytofirmans]|uniref:hypothetical protein n=1 Tax=Paraburkholderia TaxID=1822464 RepID=UPI001314135E|nr:hypothetical protein [Paraburkholderia phytofirmans]
MLLKVADNYQMDQCGGCEQNKAFGQNGSCQKSRRQEGRSDREGCGEEGGCQEGRECEGAGDTQADDVLLRLCCLTLRGLPSLITMSGGSGAASEF